MCIAKTVRAVTWQRIFISWRCVFAIKPSLVALFGVTVEFGMREGDFFPFLNRHSAKFSIGAVRKFSSAVQVEEVPEEFNSRFFLKVNFTEHLKVAYTGHGIRSNILWMELKARKDIREKN